MYTQFAWAKEKGVAIPAEKNFLFEFHGFDGNNEGEYVSYAEFQIAPQGHWDQLKGKSLNSHMPTLDRYSKMLASWKESAKTHDLTAEDFVRIAKSV